MAGWLDRDIETRVRSSSPTTTVTPVDLLDRRLAHDLQVAFDGKATFNPVRTARSAILVLNDGARRHLIWDKEFFRRIHQFVLTTYIQDEADRRIVFREVVYDLIAMLLFQSGHLVSSLNFAFKEQTIAGVFDTVARRDARARAPLTPTPSSWRLVNVGRLFAYEHEFAHCGAAYDPTWFEEVRNVAISYRDFAKSLFSDDAMDKEAGHGDVMYDLAQIYLFNCGKDQRRAMSRLDLLYASNDDVTEIACDYLAARELVLQLQASENLHSPQHVADAVCGVLMQWVVYDFIETLRLAITELAAGKLSTSDLSYSHGLERNYLRGLMLLSEIRRESRELDNDECDEAVRRDLASRLVTFVGDSMAELEQIASVLLFSGEHWANHRRQQDEMSLKEHDNVFAVLREFFLLAESPATSEGAGNALWVRALSLASETSWSKGESLDLETGFEAAMSVRSRGAIAQVWDLLAKRHSK